MAKQLRRNPEQRALTGFAAATGRPAQVDLFGTETDPADLPAMRDPRNPARTVEAFNVSPGAQLVGGLLASLLVAAVGGAK